MGESDPAGSTITAAREISSSITSPPKAQTLARPGRFTLASYVDTIREGIKKISGYKDITNNSRKREVSEQQHPLETVAAVGTEGRRKVGGIVIGVKRKNGTGNYVSSEDSHAKRKTSFETFLSTLPKSDPVDRTVVWVYQQPVDLVQEPSHKSFTSLPQRGAIVPAPQPSMPRVSTGGGYDTSISCCESDRGTHGRGTPPPMDSGQPRLDDLFRQLHVRQERQARKRLARQGEQHLTSRNLRKVESAQIPGYPPGVTPELLPFLSHSGDHYRPEPPTILHKNSFYYNQAMAPGRTKPAVAIQIYAYSCEWGECRAMLPTVKELSEHVQDEHISVLPVHLSKYKVRSSKGHRLTCEWRGCTDKGNEFPARYKLVLHVQTCHCKEHKVSTTIKGESEAPSPEPNDPYQPTQPNHFRQSTQSDYKNSTTFTSKKPLTTKHTYTAERNSLTVTSYPFPEVGNNKQLQETKTIGQSRKRRHTDESTGQQRTKVLHPLQAARTQDLINDKHRTIGSYR